MSMGLPKRDHYLIENVWLEQKQRAGPKKARWKVYIMLGMENKTINLSITAMALVKKQNKKIVLGVCVLRAPLLPVSAGLVRDTPNCY